MMQNALARILPEFIRGYGAVTPFAGKRGVLPVFERAVVRMTPVPPATEKLLPDVEMALVECGVRDGATLSFHHHLHNGDHVLNVVLAVAARMDLISNRPFIYPGHGPSLHEAFVAT
ncbi:hypothetical protein G3O06_22860 [Burkholderia sp. Ac-20345]|nr:hypothetical protein [Burkholderia sp. Ac-20345]